MIYTVDNSFVYRDGVAVVNVSVKEEADRLVKLANIALTQEPDYSRVVQEAMYHGKPNHVLAQEVITAFKEFQSRGL